jgi:hypothetical protein
MNMARKKTTTVEAPKETNDVRPDLADVPVAGYGDGPVGDVPPATPAVEPSEPQQEQVTQADAATFEPGQNHERAKLIAFR